MNKALYEDMTNQELFDKAVTGVLAQGGPSGHRDDDLMYWCEYRSFGGRKCLVGHLISDDNYHMSMENLSVMNSDEFSKLFSPRQRTFLSDLQQVHDNIAMTCQSDVDFMNHFKHQIAFFAERHNLTLTMPT